MDSFELLKALDRTDNYVAGFLAAAIVNDELSDAYDDVITSQGQDIIKMLNDRSQKFRREAGGTYVDSVSKSGAPSDRAFTLAAAADEAVTVAEDIEKSFGWEQWLLGGQRKQRRVNRDNKGRFARVLGPGDTADPTVGWTFNDKKDAGNFGDAGASRQVLPENVQGQIQQNDEGVVSWRNNINDAQREQTERYLGQIAAVQTLVQELATLFPDSRDDIEMNVTVYDPAMGGQMNTFNMPVEQDPNAINQNIQAIAPDPQNQIQQVTYGVSGNADPRVANEMRGKLMQQYGMVPETTAPEQLQRLGAALKPNTPGQSIQSMPSRMQTALDQWGAVMQTVPSQRVQALGDILRSTGQLGQAAEQLRPGMLKQSFRFRGTRRKEIDPELLANVSGSKLTNAEALVFEEQAGRFNRDRALASLKPDQGKNEELLRVTRDLATVEAQLKEAVKGEVPANLPELKAQKQQLLAAQRKAQSSAGTQLSRDKALYGDRNPPYGTNPAYNALKTRLALGQNGLQATMGAQRDAAALFFIQKMVSEVSERRLGDTGRRRPKKDGEPYADITDTDLDRLTTDIAASLGQGFPSEGLMIDRKGQPISQSIGAGEDHYLPFDLGAYKELMGGSYVRTRHSGGPTSEDLLAMIAGTGLAGTVVSRSGVFTIEMDQEYIKPSRVARMTKMYERILNDIAGSAYYINKVDPAAREAQELKLLKQKKYRESPDALKLALDQWEYDTRRQEALSASQDQEEIARRAEELATSAGYLGRDYDSQVQAKFERRAKKELRRDAERKLMINGEGYEVALRTLQRYFPYAIKNVQRVDLKDFVHNVTGDIDTDERGANDQMLAAAAGMLNDGGIDRFRLSPAKSGGGPYSGGNNALNPKWADESGDPYSRPESDVAAPAPTTGTTPVPGAAPKAKETGSEEGAEVEGKEAKTPISEGDGGSDPISEKVDNARKRTLANNAIEITRDYGNVVTSLIDSVGAPNVPDRLLQIAGIDPNATEFQMQRDAPGGAKGAMLEVVAEMFDNAASTGNAAVGPALATYLMTAQVPPDMRNNALRTMSGDFNNPADVADMLYGMLSKEAAVSFGQAAGFENGGQEKLAQGYMESMGEALQRLDMANTFELASGGDLWSEFTGVPLVLTEMAGDLTPEDVKNMNAEYNEDDYGNFPTAEAINAKLAAIDGVPDTVKGVVDEIINNLFDNNGAAASKDFSRGVRSQFARAAANVLVPIANGEKPDTSSVIGSKLSSLFGLNDDSEEKAQALASAAVLDYSLASRIAAVQLGADPGKKAQAGNLPAKRKNAISPAPKGKPLKNPRVKKNLDPWDHPLVKMLMEW